MTEQYIRGSEWRRWELHIHTPFTKKNDQFEGGTPEEKWEGFYHTIDTYIGDGTDPNKAISAIAITDYLSIDNYQKVKEDKRLPSCVKLLLPNIEMRMIPVAQDRPINIHCIFSPDIDSDIETRFLSKLKGANGFSAAKQELIRLGREHCNDAALDEATAYKTGIEQFIVTPEAIKTIFKDDQDLRSKVIIAVSNKSTDGVSGIISHSDFFTENGASQLDATRQEIYKMADVIFSATPKDKTYFIGRGADSPEEVNRKCGSLKPCIHGCDAHKNEKVFQPDGDRFCWIKADPTFEGLKQILYEPEERVFIGNTFPDEKPGYFVLDRVEIVGDENFSPAPIYLNDKLTCIIGGKSTGKSLLLHNIAYTLDPKQVDEKTKIATTKVRPIQDVLVYWRDGQISKFGDREDVKRKIVYIPQTYLNRLSDDKENTTEIDTIIQDIVLQNFDANSAYSLQIKNINTYKQQLYKNIVEVISYDSQIKGLIKEKMSIGDEAGIQAEILRLKGELDKLSSSSGILESDIKIYQENIEYLKKTNERISILDSEKLCIGSIATLIKPVELPSEIIIYSANIKEAIDAITEVANEKWFIERNEIIDQVSKEITELKLACSEKQEIIDRLKPQIEKHTQLDHISKVIDAENSKYGKIEKINEQIFMAQEKLDSLLNDIACAFEYFKEQHSAYASSVNSNQFISSHGLEFRVDVVFKTQEYIVKVNSLLNNKSLTHFNLFSNLEDIKEHSCNPLARSLKKETPIPTMKLC